MSRLWPHAPAPTDANMAEAACIRAAPHHAARTVTASPQLHAGRKQCSMHAVLGTAVCKALPPHGRHGSDAPDIPCMHRCRGGCSHRSGPARRLVAVHVRMHV